MNVGPKMLEIEIHNINSDYPSWNCNNYSIERLENNEISYEDFYENYLYKNVPCILKNVSSSWKCAKNWIDETNSINYHYFVSEYGTLDAPIANCDVINFNSQCKTNMKVSEFISYFENKEKDKLLYLKDWHLRRLKPEHDFYEVPLLFGSDWLNEYAVDKNEDDYMFVYIGPRDSWTPLHADVYSSFSWSVNVVGRKKWTLFPPGEEQKLKDSLGSLPVLFKHELYPHVKHFDVIQEQGEAIFVPSGWHHQVINLLDTISINHNWLNACNLQIVWEALESCLSSVENEIREFRDTPEFKSQCQLMLKALFGMDVLDFSSFISYIGKKRLMQLDDFTVNSFDNFKLGVNHVLFDLKVILKVIKYVIQHPVFLEKTFSPEIIYNLTEVQKAISEVLLK